jgi:hypothetical protein
MTLRWIIVIGVDVLFYGAMVGIGVAMNRRYPLWQRSVSDWFKRASRVQKALALAALAAALNLAVGALGWLDASLGIRYFAAYGNPAYLLLWVFTGAIVVGFGSLLFVRSPDEEPVDWLEQVKKEKSGPPNCSRW